MKKLLLLLFLFSFLNSQFSTLAYAATPIVTEKPKATESEKEEKLIEQINNLKEKVASKVAELRLVEKRGILLVIEEVSGNKITGQDITGKVRIIDVDELTKFSSPGVKTTFGISDMKSGLTISAVGLYNKQSKRILARFITVETEPLFVTGVVKEVDKANFTVTLTSENQTDYIVDIENITKTSTYTQEDNIKRSGFSRIQPEDRVYVVGYPNKNQKNRIIASRFLIFPDLPANPKIKITIEEPTVTETETTITPTGNSTKLTPTKKLN